METATMLEWRCSVSVTSVPQSSRCTTPTCSRNPHVYLHVILASVTTHYFDLVSNHIHLIRSYSIPASVRLLVLSKCIVLV